ncbi:MAG TPA: zf-TFIIB domain-containing protein [Longimicrobiaceae bacterium]|nr:zf-TFIIB domain-containing protein [Longimicrobiaceae bacterium]
MPETAHRMPCPVCLGVQMEQVALGGPGGLMLDHCHRCGGVWFDSGEVARLRARPPTELWKHVIPRAGASPALCHSCHAPLERNLDACPGCGWKNRIACPACDRAMERVERGGRVLDSCRGCQGVWMDRAELLTVWSAAVLAVPQATGGADLLGADLPLAAVLYAPDLGFAAGHAVVASGELLAVAPQAALAAGEVAVEAAGGVFAAVLDILGGLFG